MRKPRRCAQRLFLAFLLFGTCALPALAQDDRTRIEFFGAYSWTKDDSQINAPGLGEFVSPPAVTEEQYLTALLLSQHNLTNTQGWNGAVTFYLTRWLGLVADFGGQYSPRLRRDLLSSARPSLAWGTPRLFALVSVRSPVRLPPRRTGETVCSGAGRGFKTGLPSIGRRPGNNCDRAGRGTGNPLLRSGNARESRQGKQSGGRHRRRRRFKGKQASGGPVDPSGSSRGTEEDSGPGNVPAAGEQPADRSELPANLRRPDQRSVFLWFGL